MYTVNQENLLKLEQTIAIKSNMKGNQITFILEFPLTDNITYSYFKIYSLPIYNHAQNETLIVITKYRYLLVKGSKYLPIVKPCEQVDNAEFLCIEDDEVPYPEETCVEYLMKFQQKPTCCVQHTVETDNPKVQEI